MAEWGSTSSVPAQLSSELPPLFVPTLSEHSWDRSWNGWCMRGPEILPRDVLWYPVDWSIWHRSCYLTMPGQRFVQLVSLGDQKIVWGTRLSRLSRDSHTLTRKIFRFQKFTVICQTYLFSVDADPWNVLKRSKQDIWTVQITVLVCSSSHICVCYVKYNDRGEAVRMWNSRI